MKKIFMWGVVCAMAALMTGCTSLVDEHEGFATVPGGILVSDMSGGLILQPRQLENRKYKLLGKVKAEGKTVNYLGLVSQGDASYRTLKRIALEQLRDADDIIDVEMDFYHDNLLGIVNKVYVHMSGTAIQYLDMPSR